MDLDFAAQAGESPVFRQRETVSLQRNDVVDGPVGRGIDPEWMMNLSVVAVDLEVIEQDAGVEEALGIGTGVEY